MSLRSIYEGLAFQGDERSVSRIRRGVYERPELELLDHIPLDERGVGVLEIGGGIGVVACVLNSRLADRSRHVVVEANPHAVSYLQQNKSRNACGFAIVHRVVGKSGATKRFRSYDDDLARGSAHALRQMGTKTAVEHEVVQVTMEALAYRCGFDYDVLVLDIVGGELELLQHHVEYVRAHVRYVLVHVYEWLMYADYQRQVVELLQHNGFGAIRRAGVVFLFERGGARAQDAHLHEPYPVGVGLDRF